MIRTLFARGLVVVVGCLMLLGLGAVSQMLPGSAAVTVTPADTTTVMAKLERDLKSARSDLERAHQVMEFSGRYHIPADLSARVYDNAVAEGIPAAVAFELVQVESKFHNTAESYASAIGLTQVQLATARIYDPSLDASDLMNPDVNLRMGFRYLKDLLHQFDNDPAMALEAYNKGPSRVMMQRDSGETVIGRYSTAVLTGSRRRT